MPFNPHSPTPGMDVTEVNGMASAFTGCQQCHGSKVALQSTDGKPITVDDLKPDAKGKPTNLDAVATVLKTADGRPLFHASTWPNTGIGRLNLDGSRGSCSACHSRHDFSPRRARQPENCGKCHLGPDHPQKEIYEESKHGVAYRDLREQHEPRLPRLGCWARTTRRPPPAPLATCRPTCATASRSRTIRASGFRWTNRPPVSLVMDTDKDGKIVTEDRPRQARASWSSHSAEERRTQMKNVCLHCHTPDYVNSFYKQYDDFVILFNEKFAKPGQKIMAALREQKLLTPPEFDEQIEWTWFYLWHHEGRRARHGASMMAPDYAHWHGMYEVAERFYQELIPEARELAEQARKSGQAAQADTVEAVITAILARPEHAWYEEAKPGATKSDGARKAPQAGQTRYALAPCADGGAPSDRGVLRKCAPVPRQVAFSFAMWHTDGFRGGEMTAVTFRTRSVPSIPPKGARQTQEESRP